MHAPGLLAAFKVEILCHPCSNVIGQGGNVGVLFHHEQGEGREVGQSGGWHWEGTITHGGGAEERVLEPGTQVASRKVGE